MRPRRLASTRKAQHLDPNRPLAVGEIGETKHAGLIRCGDDLRVRSAGSNRRAGNRNARPVTTPAVLGRIRDAARGDEHDDRKDCQAFRESVAQFSLTLTLTLTPLPRASSLLVRRRLLDAVDDQHTNRSMIGIELQAQLLLERREERRPIDRRRGDAGRQVGQSARRQLRLIGVNSNVVS